MGSFSKKMTFSKKFNFMFIVHELLDSGEISPIPSENIGSEGSKTCHLPILKCSELGVMAPERALFPL